MPKRLTKIPQSSQAAPVGDREHKWTMAHSFFAGMGGFAIDTNVPRTRPYIRNSPLLHVTAQGAVILAEHGRLPDVSEGFINDKSKADKIAKSLALTQAIWLIVQCITKVAVHLPLRFLEINTLGHVMCALIIYLLWWSKPYDIHVPLVISGEWVPPLCAAMSMFSRISTLTHKEGRNTFHEWPEIERVLQVDQTSLTPSDSNDVQKQGAEGQAVSASVTEQAEIEPAVDATTDSHDLEAGPVSMKMVDVQTALSSEPRRVSPALDPIGDLQIVDFTTGKVTKLTNGGLRDTGSGWESYTQLQHGQFVQDIGFSPNPESHHFRKRNVAYGKIPRWHKPAVQLELNPTALPRWHLALSTLQTFPTIWIRYKSSYEPQGRALTHWKSMPSDTDIWNYPERLLNENFVDPKIGNWPDRDLLGQANTLVPIVILNLATAAYGGLHAAAWNAYFPSSSERSLWRFAVVFIAVSGVTWSVATVIWEKMPNSFNLPNSWLGQYIFFLVCFLVLMSASIIYIFARAYLVWEAFYSLRQLPVDAYKTPAFTQYLPHL